MDTLPGHPPALTTKVDTPKRRHSRGRLGVLLVAVALGCAALAWWHPWAGKTRRQTAGEVSQPTTVTVAHARIGDVPITLAALGTVTPLITATIKSQISGYLMQVAFTEGQEVRKGDVLAQVDARPYQAALEQFQGNLIRDQALLRNAELDLNRYRNLSRLDSISRQNVDTQAAQVAQYQGAIRTDEGQIHAQQLNIDYARITAPADGRLGLRQVDVGNYVTPGDTSGLVVLTQLKPISVIFTIPQTALTPVLLRLRQTDLAVTANASDNTTVVGVGTVHTIDNQIDTTTGTVKLRAIFANADETMFPNQFVNTSLLVDTLRNAVLIPNEAVQHGTIGTFVYLVGPDHTVSLHPITIGPSAEGSTAVSAGLAAGDMVVLDGTSRLHAGSAVSVSSMTAEQRAAADAKAALQDTGAPRRARRKPPGA